MSKLFEKFNKLSLPLTIIIASIILGGFIFASQISKQRSVREQQNSQDIKGDLERQDFLFNKKTECARICEKLYQEDLRELEPEYSVFNPSYSYSEKENACFYSGGWVGPSSNMTCRLTNCQTNIEVLTFWVINGEIWTDYCDTCVESREEYNRRENAIMGFK